MLLDWISVIGVIVFVVSVFAAYRLRGHLARARDAIELVKKKGLSAGTGSNAFPLLWFMSYDVPEGELDARMTSDVAAVSDGLVAGKVMATYTPALPGCPKRPAILRACAIQGPRIASRR